MVDVRKRRITQFDTVARRNNMSTGIAGITRYVQRDYRDDGKRKYLRFDVCYKTKGGRLKLKAFHVGRVGRFTAEQEQEVLDRAVRFRQEYERQGWM